tara:strand:- start:70 stop:1089 length:1020 start_codon:yes stop_codon:yes gene_type:complete
MHYQPVQMIGTQRSGSNLLRLMLNELKAVSAPHPPHILERLMPLLPAYGDLSIQSNFKLLIEEVCELVEKNPVPWTGINLDRSMILENCALNSLPEITKAIYEARAAHESASVWVCKSMSNIQYADALERFETKPLYLHLFRDGRDVALSFQKAIVGEKHIYYIAQQWKREQEQCLALIEKWGSKRVFQLRYETLLASPKEAFMQLCDFLKVPFEEGVLGFYKSSESKATADSGVMWENVTKPIIANNLNKFLAEMPKNEIRIFEQVAGDTLLKLGYNLQFPESVNHSFSDSEVAAFEVENRERKAEARKNLKPDDLAKRKPQEELLNRIKSRMPLAAS